MIRAFDVKNVVFREEDKDTKIYEDFKSAVKESGATVIVPKPGVPLEFGTLSRTSRRVKQNMTIQIIIPPRLL